MDRTRTLSTNIEFARALARSHHDMAENIHERVCQMITAMAGHEVHGLRNSELADALNVSRPTITRDLASLQRIGIVEQIPGMQGRWRLGPKIIQISRAHAEGMARVKSAVAEIEQRFSRNPL
ncbi:HTH domain-containing protein [Pseudohongiella sp.]|uniref:Helix-turn-helix type 11 domain-containing protein n=1 Tax=marine sediment metagenome TaxID=412755 RepID=A0A0F9YQA5_9ZZZZ|nr:HTH domain-containing protein [Pseudohongiella sp.]HDZ10049.1 HTH domain-containing protein [Pseudohongiella sp.]HEA63398.1 HTH domain-containing protein [Pseudohongiella sp.]